MPFRQYALLVLALFILTGCYTLGIGVFLLPGVEFISINNADVLSSITCSYEGILPVMYVSSWVSPI